MIARVSPVAWQHVMPAVDRSQWHVVDGLHHDAAILGLTLFGGFIRPQPEHEIVDWEDDRPAAAGPAALPRSPGPTAPQAMYRLACQLPTLDGFPDPFDDDDDLGLGGEA